METQTRTSDWRISTLGTAVLQSRFRVLQRPATPFELMDDAISYYRENFQPLLRISLWIYIVPLVASIVLTVPALVMSRSPESVALFNLLDFVLLILFYLPYLMIATPVHAALTTLAFRMIAEGEPITWQGLWQRLKPRLGTLLVNQLLLANPLYALIVLVLGLGYLVFFFVAATFAGIAASGSPTLLVILFMALLVGGSLAFLVIAAMALVWFIILPQIIVLEPNVDAFSAFSRAYRLISANYKHAVLSCLTFWGVYAVISIALTILIGLLLVIAGWIIAIYTDLEALLTRWIAPLGQIYKAGTYLAYMLVMPAMYLTSVLLYFDLRYRLEGLDIYAVLQGREAG